VDSPSDEMRREVLLWSFKQSTCQTKSSTVFLAPLSTPAPMGVAEQDKLRGLNGLALPFGMD